MAMTTTCLRDDAEREVVRLRAARALTRDDEAPALAQLDESGPWILRARRSCVRRRLRGRLLFVWQVVNEDARGWPAESCVIALTARPLRPLPRQRIERDVWLAAIGASLLPHVNAAAARWRASATDCARSFSNARIERERAIDACAVANTARGFAFQAGLFDRRAERHHREAHASGESARRGRQERLAAIAQAATPTPRPARLLLVVWP